MHYDTHTVILSHDDIIKCKHFPNYWPFVHEIHWSPVNSLHKGQWRGALTFSWICPWINGWVNIREAGDLRCHRIHYDVTVMNLYLWRRKSLPSPCLQMSQHLTALGHQQAQSTGLSIICILTSFSGCQRFYLFFIDQMTTFKIANDLPQNGIVLASWYNGKQRQILYTDG